MYLQRLGTTVFRYDGFKWFETMLAGMACHNASFVENAFVRLPHGHPSAMRIMSIVGVRQTFVEDGGRTCLITNEGLGDAVIASLRSRSYPNPGLQGRTTLLVEADGLSFNDVWRSRMHGAFDLHTCTLEDVPEKGGSSMLTTDWQAAVLGHVMGMKVVLMSGPKYPQWVNDLVAGTKSTRIVKVSDTGRNVACPCSSVANCHRVDLLHKPCLASIPREALAVLKEAS